MLRNFMALCLTISLASSLNAYTPNFSNNGKVELNYDPNDLIGFQKESFNGSATNWSISKAEKISEGFRLKEALYTSGANTFKTPIFIVPAGRVITIELDAQFWFNLSRAAQGNNFFSQDIPTLRVQLEEPQYASPSAAPASNPYPLVPGQSLDFFATYRKKDEADRNPKLKTMEIDEAFSKTRKESAAFPQGAYPDGSAFLYAGTLSWGGVGEVFTLDNSNGSEARNARLKILLPSSMQAAFYGMRVTYRD